MNEIDIYREADRLYRYDSETGEFIRKCNPVEIDGITPDGGAYV